MRKMMSLALWLALLLLLVFPLAQAAECPLAERSIHIAAVVSNQEGGLDMLTVLTQPGNGTDYTTIHPMVGLSAQRSEQQAIVEAFRNTSYSPDECDVAFVFDAIGGAESVDGPSAGMAMTVALRAALMQKDIRDDVTITGTIQPQGMIGPVGGIIDKAQAAARNHQHLLLTPKQEVYENILLRALEGKYDFHAVEVLNLSQALDIATSPPGMEFNSTFRLERKPLPIGLTARTQNEDDKRMGAVATSINGQMAAKVSAGASGPLATYKDYFQQGIAQNQQLIEEGYGYTAANNAFLSEVDAAFLNTPPQSLNLGAAKQQLQDCLFEVQTSEVALNARNIEWLAGAQARLGWASQKLAEVLGNESKYESSEEKYLALRELYFAGFWCEAARDMKAQAKELNGKAVDLAALQRPAQRAVNETAQMLREADAPDSDAQWHLGTAQDALRRKDWLAALYDASYAQGTQAGAQGTASQTTRDAANASLEMGADNYTTLWGRTYQSQGQYIIAAAKAQNGTAAEAYDILSLAQGMEAGMSALHRRLENPPLESEVGRNDAAGGGVAGSGAFGLDAIAGEKAKVPNLAVGLLVMAGVVALLLGIKQAKPRKQS